MRSLIALASVALLATAAAARPVRVWTYDDLYQEADVVAVVKVTDVAVTDARLEGYGAAGQFQGKRATAVVGLSIKGKVGPKLAVDFFTYAEKAEIAPNGALFVDLSKAAKAHYLVFLKKGTDDRYIPATGHYDAGTSFRELAGDGLISIQEAAQ